MTDTVKTDVFNQGFWKGVIVGITIGFAFGGCLGYEIGSTNARTTKPAESTDGCLFMCIPLSTLENKFIAIL